MMPVCSLPIIHGSIITGRYWTCRTSALLLPSHRTQVASASAAAAAALLCAQPRASVDVTERGVTLRSLLQLVEGGAVDGSWTIQQVVDRFVRSVTAAAMCCLFDVFPEPSTGHPQYFVSHTWSRTLNNLLHQLKVHFKVGAPGDAAAGVVLWLDIVAINQHPYEARGCLLNDDVANLARVVQATERTLFCLDPECVVLGRIWCVYEAWQTFLAKGSAGLLMLMPSAVLKGEFEDRLLRQLLNFDVREAKATQAADEDRIIAQVAGSPGRHMQVNLDVMRALVAGLKAHTHGVPFWDSEVEGFEYILGMQEEIAAGNLQNGTLSCYHGPL